MKIALLIFRPRLSWRSRIHKLFQAFNVVFLCLWYQLYKLDIPSINLSCLPNSRAFFHWFSFLLVLTRWKAFTPTLLFYQHFYKVKLHERNFLLKEETLPWRKVSLQYLVDSFRLFFRINMIPAIEDWKKCTRGRGDLNANKYSNNKKQFLNPLILAPKWASLTKANPQIMGSYQN